MSRVLALATVTALLAVGFFRPAQADPKVLLRAIAGSKPDVLVWVDTPGATQVDPDTKSFEDTFASTTWLWLDDGSLLIRRGDTLVASAHYRALDETNTFWALHNRREYTLDGSADRDPNDPTIGGATLYITVPGEDDDSFVTARIEIRLTFQQQ